jgi:hypothetical protein
LVAVAPETAARSSEVIARAFEVLAEATTFQSANTTIRRVLIPLVPALTTADVDRVVEIAQQNKQVEGAYETLELLDAIRDAGTVDHARLGEIIANSELGPRYLELLAHTDAEETEVVGATADRQESTNRVSTADLHTGMRVRHPRFGDGTVSEVFDGGRRVVVSFDDVGSKRLLTVYARLARLE